jgi:hypothetical protein
MQPICWTVAAWAIVLARNPHKHVVSLSDPSGNFLFCAQNPHHGPPINPPVCLSQWHSQGNPPPLWKWSKSVVMERQCAVRNYVCMENSIHADVLYIMFSNISLACLNQGYSEAVNSRLTDTLTYLIKADKNQTQALGQIGEHRPPCPSWLSQWFFNQNQQENRQRITCKKHHIL